jgi:hypothetical protein
VAAPGASDAVGPLSISRWRCAHYGLPHSAFRCKGAAPAPGASLFPQTRGTRSAIHLAMAPTLDASGEQHFLMWPSPTPYSPTTRRGGHPGAGTLLGGEARCRDHALTRKRARQVIEESLRQEPSPIVLAVSRLLSVARPIQSWRHGSHVSAQIGMTTRGWRPEVWTCLRPHRGAARQELIGSTHRITAYVSGRCAPLAVLPGAIR